MNQRGDQPLVRRPPWWPEGEPFPPRRRYGPPQFVRWVGCFFVTALLVALFSGVLAGAIFGRGGGGFHPLFALPIVFVIVLVIMGVSGRLRRLTRLINNLIEAAGRPDSGDS